MVHMRLYSNTMASQNDKCAIMKECRKYFSKIDHNGDGRLNRDEFAAMCEEIGCLCEISALEKSYKKADKNSDGSVTFNEFLEAFSNCNDEVKPKMRRRQNQKTESFGDEGRDEVLKRIRKHFKEIDSDENGKLDLIEFSRMLKKIGVSLKQNELERIYKKADSNGDREISIREFLSVFADETRNKSGNGLEMLSLITKPKRSDVSDADVKRGFAYFWKSDQNFDGRLDKLEYKYMINQLGMGLNQRDITKAFNVVDRNGDGFVLFMDFVNTYMNEIMSAPFDESRVMDSFHSNDINEKGYLTVEEFQRCLNDLGNHVEGEILNKLMFSASKNSTGKLYLRDFCVFVGLETLNSKW